MAKKEQKSSRFLLYTFLALGLGVGWWTWQSSAFANWKDRLLQYIDNRDIVTLEAKFLPDQVLDTHKQELVGGDKRTVRNTFLKYYPYLLLHVKYPDANKTREGVLLWGLNNGEMVLNTEFWETSHGYRDCLECQASRNHFKILQALAKRQGIISTEDLQKELQVERDILNEWIEESKQKHLIVQKGNILQLHFENPKLLVTPQTKIKQHLVSKPLGEGQKVPRTYTRNQIIAITQAAFGSDFTIRSEQEVFLPVYSFEILNGDGSIQTSEWNALTGQKILPNYLS